MAAILDQLEEVLDWIASTSFQYNHNFFVSWLEEERIRNQGGIKILYRLVDVINRRRQGSALAIRTGGIKSEKDGKAKQRSAYRANAVTADPVLRGRCYEIIPDEAARGA